MTSETNLEPGIAVFKSVLPDWWYSVGESGDKVEAICAPNKSSPHAQLVAHDERFGDGFAVELPKPATIEHALINAMGRALQAISNHA